MARCLLFRFKEVCHLTRVAVTSNVTPSFWKIIKNEIFVTVFCEVFKDQLPSLIWFYTSPPHPVGTTVKDESWKVGLFYDCLPLVLIL
jgi:hypothetical protein